MLKKWEGKSLRPSRQHLCTNWESQGKSCHSQKFVSDLHNKSGFMVLLQTHVHLHLLKTEKRIHVTTHTHLRVVRTENNSVDLFIDHVYSLIMKKMTKSYSIQTKNTRGGWISIDNALQSKHATLWKNGKTRTFLFEKQEVKLFELSS